MAASSGGSFDVIVVGGGVSGISALHQVYVYRTDASVLLLTAASFVKIATTRWTVGRHVQELEIQERSISDLQIQYPTLTVKVAGLKCIHPEEHFIEDYEGIFYTYKKLCLCTGASPKLFISDNPLVIGLRDTDSAIDLQRKLSAAKRICLVGNGGIASELVHEARNVEIIWIIRDKHIVSSYVDCGAAEFFSSHVSAESNQQCPAISRTLRYTISGTEIEGKTAPGCALGPDWHSGLQLTGRNTKKHLSIEYQTEVRLVSNATSSSVPSEWPVYVELTNGKVYGCDLVVSATGVTPSVPVVQSHDSAVFELAEDGGILVNERMETSIDDVYAAGDVCTINWDVPLHWFQMRLWSQARVMGCYAGRCIVSSLVTTPESIPPEPDFSFEMFTHVTRFFGYKIVLLGLFNGQNLDGDYEALVRVTKDVEYIKVIVRGGRVHGAVLVGETGMEETLENLILNQLDVSSFGENLLDPAIDIEDFFD